jgi:hypothetical protein
MSSRAACSLILLLLAVPLFAQDWEAFAASSDRSADQVILQIMAAGDLETSIALCRGIARRADMDAGSIIGALLAGHSSRTERDTELLVRWLLQSVLVARTDGAALSAWVSTNESSLNALFSRTVRWKSAQLKGVLLRFAVIAPSPEGTRAVMDVGDSVVKELERSEGLIPSEDGALCLDFLSAAQALGRKDFFDSCAAIARLSRDAVLVTAARAAARGLASAP